MRFGKEDGRLDNVVFYCAIATAKQIVYYKFFGIIHLFGSMFIFRNFSYLIRDGIEYDVPKKNSNLIRDKMAGWISGRLKVVQVNNFYRDNCHQ